MIYLPKMKLTSVTVLAIALWAVLEATISFTSNLAPGWTQPSSPKIATLPPAPGTGTPDSGQTPGGTRSPEQVGACKQTNKTLTALVPEKGNQGLTTAEHPVLWFYIPYAPEDIHSIEFSVLENDDKATFYRIFLQLTKTPGVIGIALPSTPEYSLKLNRSYHWSLTINCDPQDQPEEAIILDGWVTRVQPSPELVGVIWHDELTNRAKRYLLEPQNIEVKNAWVELLQSVGLEELAQAPLVGSVDNPEND
jgi:hypothetical protein